MGLYDHKRQYRFHFKEKILKVRLAILGVTLAQYLTKKSLRGDCRLPDPCALDLISRAAFEVEDYWRIVKILHKRLSRFSERKWRGSYKALILLDHLLLHGPLRVAEEFQDDVNIIREMNAFHYIDDKGFDWGLSIRKKSEHILKLIEDGSFLKCERGMTRKYKTGNMKSSKNFVILPSSSSIQNKSYLETKNGKFFPLAIF